VRDKDIDAAGPVTATKDEAEERWSRGSLCSDRDTTPRYGKSGSALLRECNEASI